MADFESLLEEKTRLSLEDVLSKIANGLRPDPTSRAGKLISNGAFGNTVNTLGTSGTVALDPTLSDVFTITPSANVTLNTSDVVPGQRLTIAVLSSGTTSYSINFSNNFLVTAALSTGTTTAKNYLLDFRSNGSKYIELARTTAL